ncbi:MAG: helix-turn-helix domain-containing protein [Acidimicrobiia bacterium]|nr:helix-turn-helix domain-containing protein [Acidimicrobiia bacterium]
MEFTVDDESEAEADAKCVWVRRIATARRAKGLTQSELADHLGITQAALSRYENDLRQPTVGCGGCVPRLVSRSRTVRVLCGG